MHVLVAGNVISFPGSGFVWHVLHSKPNARCVLWLYGIGWTGGKCSARFPGTSCCPVFGAIGCCATAGNVQATSTVSATEANVTPRAFLLYRTTHLLDRRFTEQIYFYDDLFDFLPTTSSRLVPKSLSITTAAFRPGCPVTEPPGAVVAPV